MLHRVRKLIAALPAMAALAGSETLSAWVRLYMRAYWKNQRVTVEPTARLYYAKRAQLSLGAGVHVGNFSVLMVLATPECQESPLLEVGPNTYLGDHVNVRAAGGRIAIGRQCLIANGVTIVASNHGKTRLEPIMHQPWVRGDVSIGDDVWIGSGVTILPGVKLGDGAVIGAGAVVSKEVAPYMIVAGVPAQKIGERG